MATDYPYATEGAAIQLLPAPAAAEPGGSHWLQMVQPLAELDEQIASLYEAFRDVESAVGPALDFLGRAHLVTRQGLDDREYRRLIACRLTTRWGTGTGPRVLAAFAALLGDPDATYTGYDQLATPLVGFRLVGRMWFTPSGPWITRARAELSRAVEQGIPYSALAQPPRGALYSESPGYGIGQYAIDMSRGGLG